MIFNLDQTPLTREVGFFGYLPALHVGECGFPSILIAEGGGKRHKTLSSPSAGINYV